MHKNTFETMAYIKISEPGKVVKYLKGNTQDGLTFTTDINKAIQKSSGFWMDSYYDWIMFHFKDKYPELKYASKA